MSLTPGSGSMNSVQYDGSVSSVGEPSDYATVMNQAMALKVPLGSQLNLLSAQNAGNQYLNYGRLSDQRLGSLQNVLTGYNTLTMGNNGAYYPLSAAYGTFRG